MTEGTAERWFYGSEGRRKGPVHRAALVDLLLSGELAETTLVWRTGLSEWKPASEMPELQRELPPPLPPLAPEAAFSRAVLDFGARVEEVAGDAEDAEGDIPEGGGVSASAASPTEGETGERGRRKRAGRRRRLRKTEDREAISRAPRTVLLWAWPIIVLTAVIVWLVLNRANRGPESPMMLDPASSLGGGPARFQAVFLEEPLPQTAPERYTHANATGES